LALCILPLAILSGCETDLYSHLEEREANLMIADLLDAGIPATRTANKDGTLTVKVDEASFAQAVRILDLAGLPKAKFATLDQVFKTEGLVPSPVEERARMIYAMGEELSHTVSEIDGVLSARVHIVLPDNDPLRGQVSPSSASVFIRYDAATQVSTLIPQIKTLVANSVSGLSYDKVSVVPIASTAPAQKLPDVPRMASFLGISMPEGSVGRMQYIVGALALACAALVGLLLYFLRSMGRERVFALAQEKKD
jgi:type III secretion protein J